MLAKLFGEGEDQILVKRSSNAEGAPELRFYFEVQGLIGEVGVSYADTDEGWDAMEKGLDNVTEEMAREVIKEWKEMFDTAITDAITN